MRRRIAAAGATLLVATAALTELALPAVAEHRMRGELEPLGSVTDVEVTSTPAVKLLFGGVDRAAVQMTSATLDTTALDPQMLDRARAVEVLEARIDTLRAGPLDVAAVHVDKRDAALDASATIAAADVEKLVPGAKLKVENGTVLLDLSQLPLPLPVTGPLQLQVAAEDGTVVARPLGAAAGLLPAQPLLDRPELTVQSLRGSLRDGQLHVTAAAQINDV